MPIPMNKLPAELKTVYRRNLEAKFLLVLALATAKKANSKPTTSVMNANFG